MDYEAMHRTRVALSRLHADAGDAGAAREVWGVSGGEVARGVGMLPEDVRRAAVVRVLGGAQGACGREFRRGIVGVLEGLEGAEMREEVVRICAWECPGERVVGRVLDRLRARFGVRIGEGREGELPGGPREGSGGVVLRRSIGDVKRDAAEAAARVEELVGEIGTCLGVLNAGGLRDLRAGGGDGIRDALRDVWARLAAVERKCQQLLREIEELAQAFIDAVPKLRALDVAEELRALLHSIDGKRAEAISLCVPVPEREEVLYYADADYADDTGSSCSGDSTDDEDAWEDPVIVDAYTLVDDDSQSEAVSDTMRAPPPGVRTANLSILEQLERRSKQSIREASAPRDAAESSEPNPVRAAPTSADFTAIFGASRGGGRGRGRGRGAGPSERRNPAAKMDARSVRRRLRSKLGIRKQKKPSKDVE